MCCGWELMTELPKPTHTYQKLATPAGIVKLGLSLMEKLATLLLAGNCDSSYDSTSCVVHFRTRTIPATRKEPLVQTFQSKLCRAIEELVTLIRFYYPGILGKAYIINPSDEYLASLNIRESLLRNTVLLQNPQSLADYLGSQIPPEYGGTGKPLTESDFLPNPNFHITSEKSLDSKTQSDCTAVSSIIRSPEAGKDVPTSPKNPEPTKEEPRLIYSETIGPPSIILDPEDLQTAVNLCPGKMGARLAFADSDMIVKYGHGVRLAEAEALHLVSTFTTIAAPKLLSAYILDGTGYIIMSYE
ncbi:Phosphotransferase enzyme family [Aspergillus sclerotialis]|uniref:Phosphotransferase enzyme family n=1 Tax=Aspergillus sclerotialis TaxID=2070753 RepID=A0A3A2ZGT7_9EURO|nr:Phosphotransferase enzyme family [Aspergillus sclerotialis]